MREGQPDGGTRDTLVHRTKQMVHHLFGANRCTAQKLVGRLVQTDESSVWVGPLGSERTFEEVAISIESPDNSSYVYLHAPVRRLGPERARELESAMRSNLFGLPLSGAWLALDATSDELLLCCSAQLSQVTSASMLAMLDAVAASVRVLRAPGILGSDPAPDEHGFASELSYIRI